MSLSTRPKAEPEPVSQACPFCPAPAWCQLFRAHVAALRLLKRFVPFTDSAIMPEQLFVIIVFALSLFLPLSISLSMPLFPSLSAAAVVERLALCLTLDEA